MFIGNVEIKGKAVLAPLAGVADRAMRELCLGYGAAMITSEMVSAKGFTMHDPKSRELMVLSDMEHPAAIQLFGHEPEVLAEAARRAMEFGPEILDLNMGCPAPKITRNGGASLLKDPDLAARITEAVANAVDIPVTVKMRTAWDEDRVFDDGEYACARLARMLENAGASAITIHGRPKTQMYAPPVNYDAIRAVKEAVSVPVIGNGDVRDGFSAAYMLEQTGVDAVMVGRGAMGRPWCFQQINAYLSDENRVIPEPPVAERMRVMLQHAQAIIDNKGEYTGIRETRKHAAWYVKGIRGAAQFRAAIGALSSMDDLARLAMDVIEMDRQDRERQGQTP